MTEERRGATRGGDGSLGSVARSAADVVFGPVREALRLSHRVMNPVSRRTEGGDETSESAESTTGGDETVEPEVDTEAETASDGNLEDVWGVGPARAEDLRELGIGDLAALADASVERIEELSLVGAEDAAKIRSSARDLLGRD